MKFTLYCRRDAHVQSMVAKQNASSTCLGLPCSSRQIECACTCISNSVPLQIVAALEKMSHVSRHENNCRCGVHLSKCGNCSPYALCCEYGISELDRDF